LFPFRSVLVDLFTSASYILFLFAAPTRDKWSTVLLLMLNDLLLPFFFFLLYISRKKLSALGPAKKKKAPTQQTPLFELLDGRRTRTPYGGRLYPTELPHHQQQRELHPFLSRILFFVFSILLINSDDDDFVFLKLFHRV
jgi:hypothetical protein